MTPGKYLEEQEKAGSCRKERKMTEMTMIIRNVNDIPLRTPPIAPGILVKALVDESNSKLMRVGLMSWAPGTKSQTQPHYHSVEELQFVVSGHATLRDCNGEKYPLKPGTVFLCPPGVEGVHQIENTSDFPMTLLFIYPRQDYETIKYDISSGKKLKSSIFIRDIEDFKVEPQKSPDVRTKRIGNEKNADYLTAGIMWWGPGSKLTGVQPHYHSVEEFQLVLYGNASLTDCNGEKHSLGEGAMFHCPPGIGGLHGIENTSNFPMSLLFAYPSQDFESTPYL
jgi:quercetin dioxygenase-like cupin family protein